MNAEQGVPSWQQLGESLAPMDPVRAAVGSLERAVKSGSLDQLRRAITGLSSRIAGSTAALPEVLSQLARLIEHADAEIKAYLLGAQDSLAGISAYSIEKERLAQAASCASDAQHMELLALLRTSHRTPTKLVELTGLRPDVLSKLLQKLSAAGLVQYVQVDSDKRQRLYSLTLFGEKALIRAEEISRPEMMPVSFVSGKLKRPPKSSLEGRAHVAQAQLKAVVVGPIETLSTHLGRGAFGHVNFVEAGVGKDASFEIPCKYDMPLLRPATFLAGQTKAKTPSKGRKRVG